MPMMSQKVLNTIRGKALVGHATQEEITSVFRYVDALEEKLDSADNDDMFGSDGWRHWFGHPDAD